MCTRLWKRRWLAAASAAGLMIVANDACAVSVVVGETEISSPQYGPVYEATPEAPALACNSGGCLAVWLDGRQGLGYRVWARRLHADGTPRDPAAFLVSLDAYFSEDAAVSTDGTRFLVAWGDGRSRVYLTRIDDDDSLHSESAVVAAYPLDPVRHPALAFGGDGYLLVYANGFGANDGPVGALRADRDGHILDAKPIVIPDAVEAHGLPAVVWTGTQYLMVWHKGLGAGDAAVGVRVGADGTVLDPAAFVVTSLSGFSNRPRLAVGGSTILLVAGRNAGSAGGNIDAALLDSDGRNARRVSLPVVSFMNQGMDADVAWNGSSYVVSWIDGPTNNQTVAVRVAPNGTVTDTAQIVLTKPDIRNMTSVPRIAVSGETSFIVYVDQTYPNELVRMVSLDPTGVAGHTSDPPLDISAAPQRLLAVARGDQQTLVVWGDDAQGSRAAALLAARISDDGVVLDATPIVLSAAGPNKERASASVAWGGGQYLVAWWEQTELVLGQVQVARVSAGGQLSGSPTVLAKNLFADHPTAVAASGNNFLVAWSEAGIISTPPPIDATLIGPDGQTIGAHFTIGTGGASWPWAVAPADGDGYLAAWTRFTSPSGILVAPVDAAGAQGSPVPVTTQQASSSMALVRSPGRVLVWINERQGLFLSAVPPFAPVVGPSPLNLKRNIGRPSWNGELYASASITVPDIYDRTGVDVSLLSADGVLLDPPTTVVDRRLTTVAPTAVGLGPGRNLIVYSRLVPESDQGTLRVRFQIVDNSSPPPPDGGPSTDAGDGGTVSDGALNTDGIPAVDGIGARDASSDRAGAGHDTTPGTVPALASPSGCSCALGPGEGTPSGGLGSASFVVVALAVAGRRRRMRYRRRAKHRSVAFWKTSRNGG